MNQKNRTHNVTIEKLVHGGQGLGTLKDGELAGKKALVWNVLPGESVEFTQTRSKSAYVEGVAEDILAASSERRSPKDELYLSTSPWQMMDYDAESKYKASILSETMSREGVNYGDEIAFYSPDDPWQYRNKMEYSFYGDEDGLHLALFNRGTHRKQIVSGSSIARPEIDETANKILKILDDHCLRAGDLKSVIIRCSQDGQTVAAIFTRNEKFPKIKSLEATCKGVAVCFSNPKSPASVLTRELYCYGDVSLTDTVLKYPISYDVFSFFQVNVPVFKEVLGLIDSLVLDDPLVDFYGGVGAIGYSFPGIQTVVESDKHSYEWALHNAKRHPGAQPVLAPAEEALDYIDSQMTLIVDPPRAGLHKAVTERILEVLPPRIMYLSCNPSTQARDLKMLQGNYSIRSLKGYNFFPRTPHIESLAILERT